MSGSLSNSEQLLDFWNSNNLDRIKDKPKLPNRVLHEQITDEHWDVVRNAHPRLDVVQNAAREAGRRIAEAEERQIVGHIVNMAVDAGQEIYPGDIVTIGIDTGKVRLASEGEHPLGVALKMSEDGIVTILHQGAIIVPDEGKLFVGSGGSVTVNGKHVGTVENVRIDLARNR